MLQFWYRTLHPHKFGLMTTQCQQNWPETIRILLINLKNKIICPRIFMIHNILMPQFWCWTLRPHKFSRDHDNLVPTELAQRQIGARLQHFHNFLRLIFKKLSIFYLFIFCKCLYILHALWYNRMAFFLKYSRVLNE